MGFFLSKFFRSLSTERSQQQPPEITASLLRELALEVLNEFHFQTNENGYRKLLARKLKSIYGKQNVKEEYIIPNSPARNRVDIFLNKNVIIELKRCMTPTIFHAAQVVSYEKQMISSSCSPHRLFLIIFPYPSTSAGCSLMSLTSENLGFVGKTSLVDTIRTYNARNLFVFEIGGE